MFACALLLELFTFDLDICNVQQMVMQRYCGSTIISPVHGGDMGGGML